MYKYINVLDYLSDEAKREMEINETSDIEITEVFQKAVDAANVEGDK